MEMILQPSHPEQTVLTRSLKISKELFLGSNLILPAVPKAQFLLVLPSKDSKGLSQRHPQ